MATALGRNPVLAFLPSGPPDLEQSYRAMVLLSCFSNSQPIELMAAGRWNSYKSFMRSLLWLFSGTLLPADRAKHSRKYCFSMFYPVAFLCVPESEPLDAAVAVSDFLIIVYNVSSLVGDNSPPLFC